MQWPHTDEAGMHEVCKQSYINSFIFSQSWAKLPVQSLRSSVVWSQAICAHRSKWKMRLVNTELVKSTSHISIFLCCIFWQQRGLWPVVKKRFLVYSSSKNLPKSMFQVYLMASWLKYHLSKQLQTFWRVTLRRQHHKLAPPGSCSGRGSHRWLFYFEYMHSALGHSSRFFF